MSPALWAGIAGALLSLAKKDPEGFDKAKETVAVAYAKATAKAGKYAERVTEFAPKISALSVDMPAAEVVGTLQEVAVSAAAVQDDNGPEWDYAAVGVWALVALSPAGIVAAVVLPKAVKEVIGERVIETAESAAEIVAAAKKQAEDLAAASAKWGKIAIGAAVILGVALIVRST